MAVADLAGVAQDAPVVDEALRAELVQLTATLCHALNDPKRLLILHVLAKGPATVGQLAEAIDATVANVSQHLAVLRDRGLVDSERDGLTVVSTLRYPQLIAAIGDLRGIMREELLRRSELVT
jgi:ArsR family transcriptional regulator